jgi:hypothetical protein
MKLLSAHQMAITAAVALLLSLFVAVDAASATTLEINGVAQNQSVTVTGSLTTGSSELFQDTNGITFNTCTQSGFQGTLEGTFTGESVGGKLSSFTHSGCMHTITVDAAGSLSVAWISGTTNGTVTSSGLEMTMLYTPLGVTINCKTGSGTDLGLLTGVKSGHATLDINAVINCGFFVPTAVWRASYTITSPTGLGVVK